MINLPKPTTPTPAEIDENSEVKLPAFPDWSIPNKKGDTRPLNTAANLQALANFYDIGFCLNQMTWEPQIICSQHGTPLSFTGNQIRSKLLSASAKASLPSKAVDDHLMALCESSEYHPVKNWLESENWDGINRIDSVINCLPVKNTEIANEVIKKWLVGCVASLYEYVFKSKLVPVLQGSQSFRKTAFISRLANVCPGSFLEGAELNPDNKDSVLSCIRSWIVELGELERTNKNSQGSLKAFITKDTDTVRPPYGRCDIRKPRQTHFIASVNGSDFLKDDTGSSRFFVLEMTGPAKMDELNEVLGWNYDGTGRIELSEPNKLLQFWLEVKHLYENGYGWQVNETTLEKASTVNDQFQDKGGWYQYILDRYVDREGTKNWCRAGDLVSHDYDMKARDTSLVGKALARLARDKKIRSRPARSNATEYELVFSGVNLI